MFSFGGVLNGDHMYPFYLVIKRQQPCCLTPSCLLFSMCLLASLLLNLSCASKIGTHIPTWIYSQSFLKVIVKSITNFLGVQTIVICVLAFFQQF
jgi:hypothetical protein